MFNKPIHTTIEELEKEVSRTKANIEVFKAAMAELPQQADHWGKWLKFEKEHLQNLYLRLDDMEATNNYETKMNEGE